MQTVLIVLALFLVFLSFKIALPLALGLAVVIFALVEGSLPIEIVWQSFFTSYDSFTLLAIPFFMLAGDLISAGGISTQKYSGNAVGGNFSGGGRGAGRAAGSGDNLSGSVSDQDGQSAYDHPQTAVCGDSGGCQRGLLG